MTQYCEEFEADEGTTHFMVPTCEVCKTNAYSMNINRHKMCVDNDSLDELSATGPRLPEDDRVDNCVAYNSDLDCIQCAEDFWLFDLNGSYVCRENCDVLDS